MAVAAASIVGTVKQDGHAEMDCAGRTPACPFLAASRATFPTAGKLGTVAPACWTAPVRNPAGLVSVMSVTAHHWGAFQFRDVLLRGVKSTVAGSSGMVAEASSIVPTPVPQRTFSARTTCASIRVLLLLLPRHHRCLLRHRLHHHLLRLHARHHRLRLSCRAIDTARFLPPPRCRPPSSVRSRCSVRCVACRGFSCSPGPSSPVPYRPPACEYCKKIVQDPGACCPTCTDTGCDPCADLTCATGTHKETPVGACCPICVADPPDPCTQGQQNYAAFRASLLDKVGTVKCQNSTDCVLLQEDNACGVVCNVALPSSTADSFQYNLSSQSHPAPGKQCRI